jgi:hypothetical protein
MQQFPPSPRWLGALLLAFLLGGCTSTSVEVAGSFPDEPAVRTLPLAIGVHFEEAFANYSLAEEIPERGEWNIEIGQAQLSLFRTLLPAMFRRVEELADPAATGTGLDAILIPRVEEMQFAIPFQTKSNFFEVWIRYDLTLLHPGSDRVIASWPLTGYGRTRDAMLDSSSEAIRQATIMALRDAGAFLAIEFTRTRELQPWLEQMLPPEDTPDTDDAAP